MRYDSKKLKDAMDEQLLTQREVATATGLSVTAVNLVMSGKAPWKKAIRKIAKFLGVADVVLTTPKRPTASSSSSRRTA